MFFDESTEKIQKLFISQNYDAKKCIDILLKEKNKPKDDSLLIEEWSDGDERIRAKNKQVREDKEKKRLSEESNQSTESSSTTKSKKRKLLPIDSPIKQVSKRKKVIIASDSDEEIADSKSTSSKSSDKSSLNESEDEKPKKSKKKVIVKSSSDEESSKPKKSSKKEKKKSKKEKKKKSRRDSDSNSDQSDNDYDKNDYSDDDSQDSDSEEKLTEEQMFDVLNLFNKASPEDIQSMINISPKRLELLISLRPFRNFGHLENKLGEKSLAPVLKSIKELIYARSIVSVLLDKCVKISEQMEKKVTSIIEVGDVSSSKNNALLEVKFQPKLLNKS